VADDSRPMDLDALRGAIKSGAAAFRIVTELQPAGGDGDKVFPPTYEGSTYAEETRIIAGEPVRCVLLDSVQSQANRLESALLEGHRAGDLRFPLVEVDFAGTDAAEVGKVSALEAPHRVFDGLFLACSYNNQPFRRRKAKQAASDEGKRLETATPANATPLFEICPTALVFGVWDSHGANGGLGEKFQRALVSEVIGIGVEKGVRPSSRIDPVVRTTKDLPVVRREDGSWAEAPEGASGSLKLSEVGLGNVTPSLVDKNKKPNHGGVTIRAARQITVISLPALRRLRFPLPADRLPAEEAKADPKGRRTAELERDLAAQAVLCAVALVAVAHQWRVGFSYRSRCDLAPMTPMPVVEQVGGVAAGRFSLTPQDATALLDSAVAQAVKLGLRWEAEPITLRPTPDLVSIVRRSRDLAAEGS